MQRLPMEAGESKGRRRHYDLIFFAILLAGFVFITAQRLGTVPIPETDEAYTLQVPYEMLFRGKLDSTQPFELYRSPITGVQAPVAETHPG